MRRWVFAFVAVAFCTAPALAGSGGPQMLFSYTQPSWLLSRQAVEDCDYTQSRCWTPATKVVAPSALLTTSRAQTVPSYALNSAGNLVPFSANTLRDTDLGATVEGPATNLLNWSNDLTQWTNVANTSAVANAINGPDGTLSASRMADNSGNTSHPRAANALSQTIGVSYTISGYLKAYTANVAQWLFVGSGPTLSFVNCGLSGAGSLGGTAGTGGISALAAGYYRCWLTFSAPGTGAATPELALTNSNLSAARNPSYIGSGTGLYMWGAQLEVGGVPTTPCISAGSTCTRNGDNVTRSLAGTPAGAIVVSAVTAAGSGMQTVWEFDDNTANNRLRLYRDSSNHIHWNVTTGGVDQADIDLGAVANSTTFKVAASWNTNSFKASLNGGAVSTDSAGSVPTGLTTERFGSGINTDYWNSLLKRDTRFANDNVNLQALST